MFCLGTAVKNRRDTDEGALAPPREGGGILKSSDGKSGGHWSGIFWNG